MSRMKRVWKIVQPKAKPTCIRESARPDGAAESMHQSQPQPKSRRRPQRRSAWSSQAPASSESLYTVHATLATVRDNLKHRERRQTDQYSRLTERILP